MGHDYYNETLLLIYLDGEGTPAERMRIQAHLDACWLCRSRLAALEREVLKGVTMQLGYVANRGFKFFQILDGNLPLWAANASLTNVNNRRSIAGYGLVESLNSRRRSW